MPRVDNNIDAIDWTPNITTWSTPNSTLRNTGPMPVDLSSFVACLADTILVPSKDVGGGGEWVERGGS